MPFQPIVKNFFYAFILCLFTSSCGEQPTTETGETGGIALSVNWNLNQPDGKSKPTYLKHDQRTFTKKPEISCAVINISTIKINISNQTNSIERDFSCASGSATIDEIPVGAGYTINVTAENKNGEKIYSGQYGGVSINSSAATPVAILLDKVEGVTDTAPPELSIFTINGGAKYSNKTAVALQVAATDNNLITAYHLSGPVSGGAPPTPSPFDEKWTPVTTPEETFSKETTFNLSGGEGNKTIYLCFFDSLNASDTFERSIILDTVPPVNKTQTGFLYNGAETTNLRDIEVLISAADENGVVALFVSESTDVPASDSVDWIPVDLPATDYSKSVPFTLSHGDGAKSVNTWVKDVAGNISSSVSDSIILDTTPGEVNTVNPLDGAADVPLDIVITAAFKEQMNPASISSGTFTLKTTTEEVNIPGTVTYNDVTKTATFSPSTPLNNRTDYTAAISSGIKDAADNSVTAYTWSFTTIATVIADTVPPNVESTTPADGSTDVPEGVVITAVFNEPMEPSTLNTSTIVINDGTGDIAGDVNYDQNTKIVTFSPVTSLTTDTGYTVKITTGAKDMAGNPVTAYTWSFQTVAAPPAKVVTVCPFMPPPNTAICDFNSIQEGINNAPSGSTIRVAVGEYGENITLKSEITLEGGWSISFSGRNTSSYKSIIEGAGTGGILLRGSVISDVTVDGFTIQNGSKSGIGIDNGSRVIISNNNIYNNKCGVFFKEGTEILISKNKITKNIDGYENVFHCGGISLGSANSVTSSRIENNTIAFNSALGSAYWSSDGGGIYANGAVTISENIIQGNDSTGNGGGIYTNGTATILQNSIFDNSTKGSGGGIHVNGAVNVNVSKNFIYGNSAGYGGGISFVFPASNSTTFSNNLISNNASTGIGGGIGINAAYMGIWTVLLLNNTITENSAGNGGAGIHIASGNVTIKNTILWGNTGEDFASTKGSISISYSNICDTDGVTPYAGNYNRCEDPLFVDPLQNNFHLQQTSPMIDMATPTDAPANDIDGDTRPQGQGIDIGADEVVQ